MTTRQLPNLQLRALIREADWTGEELARAVNQLGAESGWPLRYRRASVHQWLAGTIPRPPAGALLCEALTRRLGRPIGLTDAGLATAGLATGESAATTESTTGAAPPRADLLLTDLAGAARYPTRHPALLPFESANLPQPLLPNGFAAPPPVQYEAATRRLTSRQTEAAGALLPVFSAADRTYGGGHARVALAGYLAHGLVPLLHLPGPPLLRLSLLSSTAQLAYLCAFMHVDDELNGLAQRYWRAALELSRAAGDLPTQVLTLRALSIQAYELGHRDSALALAQGAAEAVSRCNSARLRAGVLGQLAVTEAGTGADTAAWRDLARAREQLTATSGPPPAIGDYHLASWDHQHAVVAGELGRPEVALNALRASATRRPHTEARSRLLMIGRLAELHLAAGQLEQACTNWHDFLDSYPLLTSRRVESTRTRMVRLLMPHRRRPSAAQLIRRAAALHRT
ncbi:hypothetical protein [Kitasatospora kifunensis]|uniref:Transcriptional regulator n=1 Tax=Kitasatospora kifunensis TaxID=58351 RepID=A0A7W7R7A8_KITKI|nr:hypothetical protein [Kitasatospora kifunensis]MBB4926634.1 hypothetical protein [Kitasatospora kifunensis]